MRNSVGVMPFMFLKALEKTLTELKPTLIEMSRRGRSVFSSRASECLTRQREMMYLTLSPKSSRNFSLSSVSEM